MHLSYQPAEASDIEACLRLLPDITWPPQIRPHLPDLWRQWLTAGAMQLCLVHDSERPAEQRLVGFGTSVFVTDRFIADARCCLPPLISAEVARQHLAGNRPVLDLETIRWANAREGVNLLVLHIGWAETLDAEEIRWVKAKLFEAFLFLHRGYRIKEVIQEVYSVEEKERGLAMGVQVRTDYAAFFSTQVLPLPEQRPFLIGSTRAECHDGSAMSPLFFYTPPRFFFRLGEQEVLRLALLDRGDEEIARALHISTATVHKRWQAIYERVVANAPDWLAIGAEHGTRGAEKRRPLLSYQRDHPEELRPTPSP